jgi:hypothetical protein
LRETQTQDRQDIVVNQMDNAVLESKSAQLRIMKKALINSQIRIPGQIFLFRLFINKKVPDKEDLSRIPLFSKLNEERK